MEQITVVGAAAIGDYIFKVDHLPKKGEIVQTAISHLFRVVVRLILRSEWLPSGKLLLSSAIR